MSGDAERLAREKVDIHSLLKSASENAEHNLGIVREMRERGIEEAPSSILPWELQKRSERDLDLCATIESLLAEREEMREQMRRLEKVYQIGLDVSAFLLPETPHEDDALGFVVHAFRDALQDVAVWPPTTDEEKVEDG